MQEILDEEHVQKMQMGCADYRDLKHEEAQCKTRVTCVEPIKPSGSGIGE